MIRAGPDGHDPVSALGRAGTPGHHEFVFVTPVPRLGDVVLGRDGVGRVLRVSGHPGNDRVVLSIWQDGVCLGTVRLAGADLHQLVDVLGRLGAVLEQPLSEAG